MIACRDIYGIRSEYSLAYEEYIDGAEIEFVKVRQRCQAIIGRVLTGVELETKIINISLMTTTCKTDHDCFALVLDDMARPSHLVSTAEAEKHKLISRIDGLFRKRRNRRQLSFCSHRG
jgi:hypothetical protein